MDTYFLKTHSKEFYNALPIVYCNDCLSLAIVWNEDKTDSYCLECGSHEIGKYDINQWKVAYIETHGKNYLDGATRKQGSTDSNS